jgi:hypothetical protein
MDCLALDELRYSLTLARSFATHSISCCGWRQVVFIGHFARDNIDPGCDVPSYFPFVLVLVQGFIGAGVW